MAEGPKYRLESDHYINDQLIGAGMVIGDGTSVPFLGEGDKPLTPSQNMTPLNDAAKAEVEKLGVRRGDPVESLKIRGDQ